MCGEPSTFLSQISIRCLQDSSSLKKSSFPNTLTSSDSILKQESNCSKMYWREIKNFTVKKNNNSKEKHNKTLNKMKKLIKTIKINKQTYLK